MSRFLHGERLGSTVSLRLEPSLENTSLDLVKVNNGEVWSLYLNLRNPDAAWNDEPYNRDKSKVL